MKKHILLSFLLVMSLYSNAQNPEEFFNEFPRTTSRTVYKSTHDNLKQNYNVTFYKLDLNLEAASTMISGNVEMHATATDFLDTIVLDLFDTLQVDSIHINGLISMNNLHENNKILIIPENAFNQEEVVVTKIFYHGDATCMNNEEYYGLFYDFYNEYPILSTISECNGSMHWWPCKQVLTDKPDSITMIVTTDSSNIVASNGILINEELVDNGKKRFTWKSNYPIAYYLVSVMISPAYSIHECYANLTDSDSVLIQSFLINDSSQIYENHLNVINKTKTYIELLSELYGLYPFKEEKYGYAINPFPLGAMENQTICDMGYESMDTIAGNYSGYYFWYSIHELGHHWFGDNVTCASWQDIWINEGFASYTEYLGLEHLYEQSHADYWMQNAHNKTMSLPDGSLYVPEEFLGSSWDILDYRLAYKKGAAFVHMIRYEVNDDSIFFKTIQDFQTIYGDSSATGDDFRAVLENNTGESYQDFFNQWYYGEGYPLFNTTWSQQDDQLEITLKQTTSADITPLFKLHLDLKIIDDLGNDTTIRVFVNQLENTYFVTCPNNIENIEIDPNNWIVNRTYDPTGISKVSSSNIAIYPNPTTGLITIENASLINNSQVFIYNSTGSLVRKLLVDKKNEQINISNLPKGVYLLKVVNEDDSYNKIILKQ